MMMEEVINTSTSKMDEEVPFPLGEDEAPLGGSEIEKIPMPPTALTRFSASDELMRSITPLPRSVMPLPRFFRESVPGAHAVISFRIRPPAPRQFNEEALSPGQNLTLPRHMDPRHPVTNDGVEAGSLNGLDDVSSSLCHSEAVGQIETLAEHNWQNNCYVGSRQSDASAAPTLVEATLVMDDESAKQQEKDCTPVMLVQAEVADASKPRYILLGFTFLGLAVIIASLILSHTICDGSHNDSYTDPVLVLDDDLPLSDP